MRRPEFIAGLGGAAEWPLAARARQVAMPVITLTLRPSRSEAAFLKGLSETGLVEGQNVAIEHCGTAFATASTIHGNDGSRVSLRERNAGA